MDNKRILKVGVIMVLLSLTLAAGAAAAVVGLRREEAPKTTAVSSVGPQAAEETTQEEKKFNLGQKLEIDDGSDKKPEAPNPQPEPAPEPSVPAPPPLPTSIPNWPGPTNQEVASSEEPRYFTPDPGADMTLTVPALGLYDVPVFTSDSIQALDTSLMHVPETSFPWDGGAQRNVYIAGHYLGWPGTASRLVFYNLDKLSEGDEVILKDREGRAYRYRVSESFMAGPDESWVMGQEVNRDMVTLQTCIPPTFAERLIVQADRV